MAQLKEYQLKGPNWLATLYEQGINGILADDAGLGKTVQSISLLAYLAETHDIWGPFLVVAPASTLQNWQQELARFVPKLKTLPYWGNVKDRATLRKFWSKKGISFDQDALFHVLITSYQLVTQDQYEKIEKDIYVDLSARQRALYKALLANVSVAYLLAKAANVGDVDSARSPMNLVARSAITRSCPELFERADVVAPYSFCKYSVAQGRCREKETLSRCLTRLAIRSSSLFLKYCIKTEDCFGVPLEDSTPPTTQ
ncbi:hypothetical protein HGRIS_005413 [Hohenbuehelia grisea]|uniref:Chromatin-remodeling ATPase INO80 n=1 Tax=Hohenbuehelia grisea TaxID=104357 RepID=A0ABR3JFP1_9AGAR